MSTGTPQPPSSPNPLASPTAGAPKKEILIVSHSPLLYWWPVWAVGFLMAAMTLVWGDHMADVERGTTVETVDVKGEARSALVAPKGKEMEKPRLLMTRNTKLGVIFSVVLLFVIVITNVPLRGLWSGIVIVVFVSLVIILALAGVLDNIVQAISLLDIRINFAGYFVISTVLFIIWLVVFYFFDRQIYMVFTPGQLRVRLEIGDAETAYDTTGMTIQKQRSDLFRHWVLGLGSGDLIVRTAGAQAHHFDMANVLALGRRVREIEEMLRSRQVVQEAPQS